MKLLLIDDHPSFCQGLISAAKTIRPDLEIDYESGSELVPRSLVTLQPYDLILFDLLMPGVGGFELIKVLNQSKKQTPFAVMSSVDDPEIIAEVIQLGARGFIPKSYCIEEIISAIEDCLEGKLHLPPDLRDQIDLVQVKSAETSLSGLSESGLSRRQIEVVSLIDLGMSNRDIADTLNLSLATIKWHINVIYKTFDVHSRTACVREAKKRRLIPGAT